MNNWSDYPIFLAVAETGSLTAAGEQLGISQPTVGRRIKTLETQFGAPLLTKEDGRLAPTEFGHLVLDHIKRMGVEADAITRSSATLEDSLAGPILIAASEGIGDWWLPSVMQEFRQHHPDVVIDINVDFRAANLAQREADIALRWMGPGTQNSLIGRKVTTCGFGLFASKSYVQKRGLPTSPEDLLNHDVVRMMIGKEHLWPLNSDGDPIPAPSPTFQSNNLLAHNHAIQAGYGIGMLAYPGTTEEQDLVRILPELERVEDLWVVAHEDLRKSARVRTAFDFLIDALQKDHAHFRSGAPSVFVHMHSPQIESWKSTVAKSEVGPELEPKKLHTSVA
ncbi:MAG: hypothetical protein COA69_12590 [Robiginitomaculum sp.]|nr:MAG: hypothetical protein COA69_12590 [Robiginitomaculum sp.]